MPDLNQATTVRRAKRGYRRVTLMLKVAEYDIIAGMAEQESRSPDQQAAYMLRRMISELQVEAIKNAYREAEDRHNGADLQMEEIAEAAER